MKDKKHLTHIRTLPCLICGDPRTVAHHVRSCWSAGMGRKSPDSMCLPLCAYHHNVLHNSGEKIFWEIHGANPYEEILKIIINKDKTPF